MPEVLVGGEKKKVACGPCIRGHRSSKCAHRDRVLIEVRKPGRPLSACPHPAGSCSCARQMYYAVPKESDCPMPMTSTGFNPSPSMAGRVQKPRDRRTSSNVVSSRVQKALDGSAVNFGHASNAPTETSSNISSGISSMASSSSSTPLIEPADTRDRHDSQGHADSVEVKSEPRLQLGMMGVGGFGTSTDPVGWTGAWPDVNGRPGTIMRQDEVAETPSCCQPRPIPEEPKGVEASSNCCGPAPSQHAILAQPRQDNPQSEALDFGPMPTNLQGSIAAHNMDSIFNHAVPFTGFSFMPSQESLTFDYFAHLEGQHGCGSHVPGSGNGEGQDCHCGEGCLCLGCATHPVNRTTVDYVRYHNELASRGYPSSAQRQTSLPQSHQQSAYGLQSALGQYGSSHAAALQNLPENQLMTPFNPTYPVRSGYGLLNGLRGWELGAQPSIMTPSSEPQLFNVGSPTSIATPTPNSGSNMQFQSQDAQAYLETSHSQGQHSLGGRATAVASNEPPVFNLPTRGVRDQEGAIDYESPATDDDASTLSPSSFHIQQYNLPGCNDITGTCQCGDGCRCDGCLTHSGHDNESENDLAAITSNRQATMQSPIRHEPDLNGFSLSDFHSSTDEALFAGIALG